MKLSIVCCLAIGLGSAFACSLPLHAQNPVMLEYDIKPALVRNDAGDVRPALGLNYNLDWHTHKPQTSFSSSTYFQSQGALTFVRAATQYPDQQRVELTFGRDVSLRKVRRIDPDAPLEEEADKGPFAFDWGVVGLGLYAKYEAALDWNEQVLDFGAEVRYTHDTLFWLPAVYISYFLVKPITSDVRNEFGDPLDAFQRLEGELTWMIPLGRARRFGLLLTGRGFRSFGLTQDVADTGFKSGLHYTLTLAYSPQFQVEFLHVNTVFLSWTDGRLPTFMHERNAATLGIALSF